MEDAYDVRFSLACSWFAADAYQTTQLYQQAMRDLPPLPHRDSIDSTSFPRYSPMPEFSPPSSPSPSTAASTHKSEPRYSATSNFISRVVAGVSRTASSAGSERARPVVSAPMISAPSSNGDRRSSAYAPVGAVSLEEIILGRALTVFSQTWASLIDPSALENVPDRERKRQESIFEFIATGTVKEGFFGRQLLTCSAPRIRRSHLRTELAADHRSKLLRSARPWIHDADPHSAGLLYGAAASSGTEGLQHYLRQRGRHSHVQHRARIPSSFSIRAHGMFADLSERARGTAAHVPPVRGRYRRHHQDPPSRTRRLSGLLPQPVERRAHSRRPQGFRSQPSHAPGCACDLSLRARLRADGVSCRDCE